MRQTENKFDWKCSTSGEEEIKILLITNYHVTVALLKMSSVRFHGLFFVFLLKTTTVFFSFQLLKVVLLMFKQSV